MTKETLKDVQKGAVSEEQLVDQVKFISTDEEEQEGNFEFLCCRGGSRTGPANPGHGW
ncbi:hypothetical protein QMS78_01665 [Cronobacter dublinensis]|nr:hypothetical protein [Cronobacter dublinensis]MDI6439543.1 hypothetical protein [Cronobacter dublinensis]MDI6443902.1 hypothetical protein [Cronobacter dublinensis]MDK1251209.1 hypothetical protein [Cronobacter dublinensis]